MPKIFISTIPFGVSDPESVNLLKKTGWEFKINPTGRKLTPEEVGEFAEDADALIAGTEKIETVLKTAKQLKLIARIGIGLDSVPLKLCRENGIAVTYTPDAMSAAVAEMAVGAMIILARDMHRADKEVRKGTWKRPMGLRIGKATIGLVGLGRIGSIAVRLLAPFKPESVLIHDAFDQTARIDSLAAETGLNINQVSFNSLLEDSDLISLHVPFTSKTHHLIDNTALNKMKPGAYLINYARGGIVQEDHLLKALENGTIAGAALDCFEEEPYTGPLAKSDKVLLTPHMGSSSSDCRANMEIQAVKDVIRFFNNENPDYPVPDFEYENQG